MAPTMPHFPNRSRQFPHYFFEPSVELLLGFELDELDCCMGAPAIGRDLPMGVSSIPGCRRLHDSKPEIDP